MRTRGQPAKLMPASLLPKASGRQHVKAFCSVGWIKRRQSASHIILSKPGYPALLSIPDHKEVAMGTLRQLVRISGLTDEDYRKAFDGC
jgi:predicted RNA binding protein YcfA (HicA-like mRNA interferase family)